MALRAVRPSRRPGLVLPVFDEAKTLIETARPDEPIYCLYPHVLKTDCEVFTGHFPGTPLYAVKANPSPHVLRRLYDGGIRHFDTASIPEIRDTLSLLPNARCYFMAPVRLKGAAAEAYFEYGVRDFVIDCEAELRQTLQETGAKDLRLFVRHATPTAQAALDLSRKFGASAAQAADLLRQVSAAGCEPALSFHVGSLCLEPAAFARAISLSAEIKSLSGVDISTLNVGGGFPVPYPSIAAPQMTDYFTIITKAIEENGFSPSMQVLCEPGRALSANSLSVITQVIRRRGNTIFLNDGVYGSFCETVQLTPSIEFPTRVYRQGQSGIEPVAGTTAPFRTFGPTCDSVDVLPWEPHLPTSLEEGDWVEFGLAGAYTVATRTEFNGMRPERFVVIGHQSAMPPGL
ncbi:MAG: type III PLP-dependent enzyme [Pseudomonadota bacterium]